jgi:hypothetical protein
MNEPLVAAIKDRISLGWSKEAIASEVVAAGHTNEDFESAYSHAINPAPINPSVSALQVGVVLKKTSELFLSKWRLGLQGLLAMLLVLFVGGGAVFGLMVGQLATGPSWFSVVAVLVIAVLGIFATTAVGLAVLSSLLRRDEDESFGMHMRLGAKAVWPVLMASFYVSILTQIGYTLFFVPGLILAVLLSFVVPAVLLNETKGLRSLTHSASLVYGRFFKVLWIFVVNAGLLIVGAMLTMSLFLFGGVEPMLLFLLIPLAVLVALAIGWWQVCFLVVLFEALKTEPGSRPLPISERFWRYLAGIIVGLVTVVLAVFVFVLSFGMTELFNLEHGKEGGLRMNDGGMMQDIVSKQFLQTAVLKANMIKDEEGSYYSVCNEISLPEGVDCRAGEESFRFEVKLSDGYYCVDALVAETFATRAPSQTTTCAR